MVWKSSERNGLFSPDSISFLTTVISLSRSFFAMNECVMASADHLRYHSRFSSLAAMLAK
jgi:hypothetical protein